jgi:hypothetical protein
VIIVDALTDDGGEVFSLCLFCNQLFQVRVVRTQMVAVARLAVVDVVGVNGFVLRFSSLELDV